MSTQIQIGEFIEIPAWNVQGQVIGSELSWYGSDDSQRVLLQERPDASARWYQLEPTEFRFI